MTTLHTIEDWYGEERRKRLLTQQEAEERKRDLERMRLEALQDAQGCSDEPEHFER